MLTLSQPERILLRLLDTRPELFLLIPARQDFLEVYGSPRYHGLTDILRDLRLAVEASASRIDLLYGS